MRALVSALLLVTVGSCRARVDVTEKKPMPAPASASATTSATAMASAIAPTPEDDVRRVAKAWNGALDAHDVDALPPLYGRRVHFYTKDLSKADVVTLKRRALGAQPIFASSSWAPSMFRRTPTERTRRPSPSDPVLQAP